MDLETENKLAAMLMREAAELRQQAEKEGVLAYLHRPNVRARPNSRFLTATVRGVQQANRAVEVNEMWRVRQKELDLDKRVKGESKDKSSDHKSSKQDHYLEPEGLKDEELEEFLHSRTKRGRGTVGPRMDETGPYLPPRADGEASPTSDVRERRVVYGPPKRPPSLDSYESSEEELHKERRKKWKKSHSGNSDKHSKKHRSKEKSKHKKKKRDEKKK